MRREIAPKSFLWSLDSCKAEIWIVFVAKPLPCPQSRCQHEKLKESPK